MQNKIHVQFSPTRLKQIKKIALSGSRAKLQLLNGKFAEGFQNLKSTAQKFKSFVTDLADSIPQTLATRISLGLFSHFESKSSKRLGISKGIVLGGVLALMSSLPAVGQTFIDAPNTTALNTAIGTANGNAGNYVIRLDEGKIYALTGSLPTIANNGTLQIICTGTSNAIIDGAGSHRPLRIASNANLTISNITVQNGSAQNGGGIYNEGNLTITSSSISGNTSSDYGGGISNYFAGNILIIDSSISGNVSNNQGGGIYNTGSNVTIINSSISGNTSSDSGGGIYNSSSNLTISNSSISGNMTSGNGGGVFNTNSDNVSITNSSISENTSNQNGGGVFNTNSDNLTISSSTISGNRSVFNGGGINNVWRSHNMSISNSFISDNTSNRRGGGIHNDSSYNLTISSSTISGNTSRLFGGGIYNFRGLNQTISNSSISGNTSTNGGGGGISNRDSDNLSISSSSISGSTRGGIFNADSPNLSISNSSISGNSGVGIWNFYSDNLSISSSSISGNIGATGVLNENSSMTIQASSITLNSAITSTKGGGLYLIADGSDVVNIINTTISSNETSGTGGIYSKSTGTGNTLTLQHVTISDNTGVGSGGFANNAASTLDITLQNTIIGNSTGADFVKGTATINAASTNTIVQDASLVNAGILNIDPLLGTLVLNSGFLVHPLQVSSTAIGGGANIGIATDQVGNARVLTNPAIGAVEITTADLSSVCMVVSAPTNTTNTWIGCTNTDWGTASNWSTGVVPVSSDRLYVPRAAANPLIIDEVAVCSGMKVQIGARYYVNYMSGGRLMIRF